MISNLGSTSVTWKELEGATLLWQTMNGIKYTAANTCKKLTICPAIFLADERWGNQMPLVHMCLLWMNMGWREGHLHAVYVFAHKESCCSSVLLHTSPNCGLLMNSLLMNLLLLTAPSYLLLANIRGIQISCLFCSPGVHDGSEILYHDTLGRQEEEEEDLMNSNALSSVFASLSPKRKRLSLAYLI